MSSLLAASGSVQDPFAPFAALTVVAALGADALSSVYFGIATGPDLLRLVAVPVFAWATYRDVKTRRVPNRTWVPLLAVGVLALAWDAWIHFQTEMPYEQQLFLVQVVISLGMVAPLGYLFWRLGGFGGADAKALITLAVLFPIYPTFYLEAGLFPHVRAELGVFSLTILSNTVLFGLAYPLLLALRNLPRGEITPAMFIGRPVSVDDILSEYGRLLENPDGFTRQGLDVDALRMYLRWRGVTLADLRADPERYRHPLPTERNDPGDGSIVADERARTDGGVAAEDETTTDGGAVVDDEIAVETADGETEAASEDEVRPAIRPLDDWGAERFLAEHRAYGTTPDELREGLAVLTEPDRETVWLTPGIPFILPMFVGLVVALSYGDVLFAILTALGLA